MHEFCDHCPGCRPAMVDTKTGQTLAPDSPIMILIQRIWDHETTYAERKAYIEVTSRNSRNPETMRLALSVMAKIQTKLAEPVPTVH